MSTAHPKEIFDASHQALELAAEWFALLRSEEASDADRIKWQTWLDAAEENRTAWTYVERISGRFLPIQNKTDSRTATAAFQTSLSRQKRRRQVLFGFAACVGSGLLGWSAWQRTAVSSMALAWVADYHTGIGEVREVQLSDGTQVWLGSSSAFNQNYDHAQRRLELVRGEILIQTAADATRPFMVDTAHGSMRALGTRFTARLDEQDTLLAVYEGAVEIRTSATAATTIVRAGQQVRFNATEIARAETADPAHEASTRGILIAQNIPLEQVVQELRRYYGGHLALDPALAQLPVFGSYPAYDLDRTLSMLASVMPIRVRRPLPWWISIGPDT
jgi:transmembrane sensor